MDDVELKPCPFCGSTVHVWELVGHDEHGYGVECDNDECGCTYGENMELTFEEVVKMWNRRV